MTFQHRAGVSPHTSSYDLAETCVFGKQLLGPFLCGLDCSEAPLIANLRGKFAEFLNNASPARLRILSSSTCVGLRYGRLRYTSILFSPQISCASTHSCPLRPGFPSPGSQYVHVSYSLNLGGYGISTVCASTTPFGLALAPGLPWADEPTPGNLRFSAIAILAQFSLLIPAFSLL